MKKFSNISKFIRLEAILIHFNRSNLCKKIELDYTLALVT